MKDKSKSLFEGITEIDEAYIGGPEKNRHMKDRITKPRKKTVVIGMVNRDTKEVVAKKVESAKTYDLQPEIYSNIKEGSTIITDEWKGYDVLKWNYKHEKVNHSKYEYVRKDERVAYKIHTNTIEGFWGIVKRGINGIYHWVSKKYIDLYLQEYSFRYNKRALTGSARFESFFENIKGKNLSFKELVTVNL